MVPLVVLLGTASSLTSGLLGVKGHLGDTPLMHSFSSALVLRTLFFTPQKNFIAVSAANRFKKISSSGALMALGV